MSDGKLIVNLPDGTPYVMYEPHKTQLLFHQNNTTNLIAVGNRGGGKGTRLDTLIPTPVGYKTMASIQVGDQVFSERGIRCNVISKSAPYVDELGTYKLTFDDGNELVVGGCHEWWVFDKHARDRLRRQTPEWRENRRNTRKDNPKPQKRRAVTIAGEGGRIALTQEIADNLIFKTGIYKETNFAVRLVSAPWEQDEKVLPIPPYVLGIWLGDGCKNDATVCSNDPFIIEEIERQGYTTKKYSAKYVYGVHALITQIKNNNLYKNKHIPEIYFLGSANQRLALLQGLMDTDGNCEKDGKAEFCNTSYKLARGVYRLAASLGLKPAWSEGRATLYGKDCGPKYRVAWTASSPVFKLPRKLARIKSADKIRRTQQFRFVVKAERIADEWLQCIQVDSPSHLYLVGEVGIPTHNSQVLRYDAHMRAMSVPGANLILVRKTFPQLYQSHLIWIRNEMELLGGDYHDTKHIATYSNGSRLFFSHVATEGDALNLLSAEFLAAYYDELSTIPWDYFTKLSASVRVKKGYGLTAVTRAATNPLGPSADEIRRYYVDKDVTPDEDPDYNPVDWGYIRIDRQDNPHIDQEQYIKRFTGMPAYLRKAWLEGEFALENQLFDFSPKKDGKPYHVINTLPTIGNRPIISLE